MKRDSYGHSDKYVCLHRHIRFVNEANAFDARYRRWTRRLHSDRRKQWTRTLNRVDGVG